MATIALTPGRVPPNDLDAEVSVLGSILVDPLSIAKVLQFLHPEGEDVQFPEHRNPGRDVERADDHAQRRQQGGLGRRRHAVVAEQAVGQLGVPGNVGEDGADAREVHGHG